MSHDKNPLQQTYWKYLGPLANEGKNEKQSLKYLC